MKHVRLIFFLCLVAIGGKAQDNALSVFCSGGGGFAGTNIQQSWTIGEPITESFSGQSVMFSQGFQQSLAPRTLSGLVRYDNSLLSPMDNTTVLLKVGTLAIAQKITDSYGHFSFTDVSSGSFTLTAQSSKPWGGATSSDALLIAKYFAGMISLTDFRAAAGDVNGSGGLNSVDAMLIAKRFVGIISSFPVGDWCFEKHNVILSQSDNVIDNFKGLCYGDVNGSYVPNAGKTAPTIEQLSDDVIKARKGESITIPVVARDAMDIAAVSLVINYPDNILRIEAVESGRDNDNLVFNTLNDELRIAWYSLKPMELTQGDVILTIRARYLDSPDASSGASLVLAPESSIGNFEGDVLVGKHIGLPSVISAQAGFDLAQCSPNPANTNTLIHYTLADPGMIQLKLMNIYGEEIQNLMEKYSDEGSFSFNLNTASLPSGIYLYAMSYDNGVISNTLTKRLIVIH